MRGILIVGSGSFLGGICRYWISGWIASAFAAQRFPLGTLAVNFLGCFAIGLVGGLAEQRQAISEPARLFLMTGLLGGFTTFSAFGYETLALLRAQEIFPACAYVFLSVATCLAAVWLGLRLTALA